MNYAKKIIWTPQADQTLRAMHAQRFTFSGIAQRLGCRRLDAVERAVTLGIEITAKANSSLAREVSQARKDLMIGRAA